MLKLLLQSLAWLLAHCPERLLHAVSIGLGELMWWTQPKRRRIMLSNLDHAFPDRGPAWCRQMARRSCRRLMETGLFTLAMPALSAERLRGMITASPAMKDLFAAHRAAPFPVVMAAPHMAYWEVQTAISLAVPGPFPEFAAIYRPLRNVTLDTWVRQTRELHGMKLLSRKEGFHGIMRLLKRRGMAAILFDQNARRTGALTLLFDRVCSTTELPGMLAEKTGAQTHAFYARRLAFWRVEIHSERIAAEPESGAITIAVNRWLEHLLATDEEACACWLWAHNRWGEQSEPQIRYRLAAKRNLLPQELAARGLTSLPRRTRFYIRLPNWLGDVVMVLPLLRALRASRPDAAITLIGKASLLPLLRRFGLGDHLLALPPRGAGYFHFFRNLRRHFPDNYLLFTNSQRGDLEAWLTGSRQRFGIIRPGRARPLLSHGYRPPADFDEARHHQLELWTNFMNHFGLSHPPDLAPLQRPAEILPAGIGLIAGSENNPGKRWPVAHWRALISQLPSTLPIRLFGTANDRAITSAIAAGFGPRVQDLAGRTNLDEYCDQLTACELLVTNDTGGMHLANALGVPLLALFGPTNPVRTRPVFAAPVHVAQPPGCPPTGGALLADLTPETVIQKLRTIAPSLLPPAN
ncbi:MAG TPA: glycosyltransferase family 9 protein [Opitutaceae bacterium]|nr:glycosyltransferase family 9 protein [Opitutaceae bacterium]HRJ45719.1 glycosyltransferase family 9 protein [Opitutaceae bacterium]